MRTAKKSITFYPTDDVAMWLETFDAGDKSRKINEAIRASALKPKSLFEIPLGFYEMSNLLHILKETVRQREETAENVDEEQMQDANEDAANARHLLGHFEKFVK